MQSFISRECDYAIRITAYLAGLKSKSQMPVSEISLKLKISKQYAARIIHTLKNAGILKTTQGVLGGVSLAKPGNEISFLDILKAMNFNSNLNDCTGDKTICGFPSICRVHSFLAKQEARLLQEFKNARISDYAFNERQIDKTL